MTSTRRDLCKLAGGAAVGALFTPAPWRLVTDTALWSETWPGVPRTARGEIRARYTNCSLCPAGCAVRARCVGEQPVALIGVLEHPFTHGAMCPFGVAGHHLPYHPARITQGPVKQAATAISDALARCAANERIAVLDLRPGRTASWTFRRALAQWKNGTYLAPPRTLGGNLAVNLAAAKTVLSFGAPLLDGWGTPGNVIAARDGFRLMQAETVESRTAVMADEWLPIRPGSETALARAIANVLGNQPLHDAALETGLSETQIVSVARELADNGPALVLDARERPQILALNQLVGALGHTIVTRREAPVPGEWKKAVAATELEAVPDGSVRILLIDESTPGPYLPWSAIEKKLVTDNPVVVAFAWSGEGYGRHAQFVLPTAVYPEVVDDIPPAVDSPAAMFRLSAALVPPPADVVNPAEFLAALAAISAPNALRERADAIHRAGRGTLFTYADTKSTAVKNVKADDFWKALNAGGCWMDALPERQEIPKLALAPPAAPLMADSLPLAVVMTEGPAGPGSPILSKLYQESNLRLVADRVVLHPAVARECRVEDGGRAILETNCGRLNVQVSVDAGAPLGVVQVAGGPRTLDLCGSSPRAKVVRV
jgi:anaerobic selenocysteine-containing dehydrogenase